MPWAGASRSLQLLLGLVVLRPLVLLVQGVQMGDDIVRQPASVGCARLRVATLCAGAAAAAAAPATVSNTLRTADQAPGQRVLTDIACM